MLHLYLSDGFGREKFAIVIIVELALNFLNSYQYQWPLYAFTLIPKHEITAGTNHILILLT